MRKFPCVFMRGGTSKGCMFLREDLPDRREWDDIFVQAMGSPDPKQIDGLGGCVSSNNKIVVVYRSERPGIDVDYIVGQSIVGESRIDYKSNCGNMTAATAPFAVEMGLVDHLTEPVTTVHLFNLNTNKAIDVDVPMRDGQFDNEGDCAIAGVDGTAGELKVNFLDPAGSKTGKLFPTGAVKEMLPVPGYGEVEATILDVSNPIVLVRAEILGLTGTELPAEVDANKKASAMLEAIRGAACVKMGFAEDPEDARKNSPAVPKVGFVTTPKDFTEIGGQKVPAGSMDICARVISVFKCHKACPLTSASAISVAAFVPGTLVYEIAAPRAGQETVRVGHPSGVMTMYSYIENPAAPAGEIQGSGHPQRTPDIVLVLLHKSAERMQFAADLFCCLHSPLSHRRQADPGAGADEKLRPQFLLDVFQPLGQSGLGEIEFRRSPGKIACLRQCDQQLKIQFIHLYDVLSSGNNRSKARTGSGSPGIPSADPMRFSLRPPSAGITRIIQRSFWQTLPRPSYPTDPVFLCGCP